MVGSMPYDPTRKSHFDEVIKKQEDDAKREGGLPKAKLSVKGRTTSAPIYRFKLDDLAYNKSNGRIKAEIIEKEAELGRSLNQFDKADDDIIGEILLSIRQDENEKIKKDLKDNSQLVPGIITVDGVVINGNRRKALFKELYDETNDGRHGYLEAHVLPSDISKSELWLIEAGIQLSNPQQLDYSPINNLLKLREGIYAGLTEAQMASRIYGVTEEKIKVDLERLYLIDEYLSEFLEKPGKYYLAKYLDNHFINLINILNYFKNPRGKRRDWDPTEDDLNELKIVAFYYIRMRLPHLRIRDLRDIFLTRSSWEKVKGALCVDPRLTEDEKVKCESSPTTEESVLEDDDDFREDEDENKENVDKTLTTSEEQDTREETVWRENKKSELFSIYEDAKELKSIHDKSEKPQILAKRALDNIQGIPEDGSKLMDPEIDKILSEIIQRINILRKEIRKTCKS
ncbi:hypothetical protein ACFLTV_00285 [Chloroflexota bacterium]